MVKFYVRWRMNPKVLIKNEYELNNNILVMLKRVRTELQAGLMKDWGICADGSGGYMIYEVPDEAKLFELLDEYKTYLGLEARQVLTVEQAIESRKPAASQTSK